MKLFVGIDVSSEKLDVCFLTDDNQLSILSEISVANDIEGASFIRETILEYNGLVISRNTPIPTTRPPAKYPQSFPRTETP
ncbi:hypothetical protein EfmJHP35_16370 [Enterococcus faecium]|nr:hypothetical protein EfmJHP35_16370 [Enterococcus faecium]